MMSIYKYGASYKDGNMSKAVLDAIINTWNNSDDDDLKIAAARNPLFPKRLHQQAIDYFIKNSPDYLHGFVSARKDLTPTQLTQIQNAAHDRRLRPYRKSTISNAVANHPNALPSHLHRYITDTLDGKFGEPNDNVNMTPSIGKRITSPDLVDRMVDHAIEGATQRPEKHYYNGYIASTAVNSPASLPSHHAKVFDAIARGLFVDYSAKGADFKQLPQGHADSVFNQHVQKSLNSYHMIPMYLQKNPGVSSKAIDQAVRNIAPVRLIGHKHHSVLNDLASHPNASPETIDHIAKIAGDFLSRPVSVHHEIGSLPRDHSRSFAYQKAGKLLYTALSHKNITPTAISTANLHISKALSIPDANDGLLEVLKHRHVSVENIQKALTNSRGHYQHAALKHPSVSAEFLDSVADNFGALRISASDLIGHRKATDEIRRKAVEAYSKKYGWADTITSSKLSPEHIRDIHREITSKYKDNDSLRHYYYTMLAKNKSTPSDLLDKMYQDSKTTKSSNATYIRKCLGTNPNTSPNTMKDVYHNPLTTENTKYAIRWYHKYRGFGNIEHK